MEKIIKENGNVYLVHEHDANGGAITRYFLGKDPEFWEDKDTPKKRKTKKEDNV